MKGFPLTVSKGLMKNLLGQLRPEDRFNVVLFAGAAAVLSPRSLPATQENLDQAWALIDGQQGGVVPSCSSGSAVLSTCLWLERAMPASSR